METVRQRLEEKMNNDNIPKLMDVLKEKQKLENDIVKVNGTVQEKNENIVELQKKVQVSEERIKQLENGIQFNSDSKVL